MPRALPTGPGKDSSPAFSPDGRFVAYVAGGDPKDLWYGASHVAIVPVAGGPPSPLTAGLDRNVAVPRFTPDGRAVLFLLEDRGNRHLARVPVGGGERRARRGRRARRPGLRRRARRRDRGARDLAPPAPGDLRGRRGRPATPDPRERRRPEGDRPRPRGALPGHEPRRDGGGRVPDPAPGTRPRAGRCRPSCASTAGPPTSTRPRSSSSGRCSPAHGYAVVAANPRGSTGRGTAFSRAIWADWGNKDFEDVMAAVDHAVAAGRRRPRPPRRRRLELRRHPHRTTSIAKTDALQGGDLRRGRWPTTSPATAPTTTSTSGRWSWACPGRPASSGSGSRPPSSTSRRSRPRRSSSAGPST